MITASLKGGLGGQMFQIAATYALALDNNDECAFNFDSPFWGNTHPARFYATNVFKKIRELPKDWVPDVLYIEPMFNYSQIPYQKNMMLYGHYATDKYFINHKKEIISLFRDQETIDSIEGEFANSVSLHVRRDDYLWMSSLVLDANYYQKAIREIDKMRKIERIYVFSDDISWCKENLRDDRIGYIEGNPDYIDFYIMMLCENNIIGNSTFSLWVSILNKNKNKIVIAPASWFGVNHDQGREDIYCDNWIRV